MLPYQSPQDQEIQIKEENKIKGILLNAWTVQNIVYELIKNFMLANLPSDLGIPLSYTFDADQVKSQIFLDIAYNWKKNYEYKRPSIFIQRGAVSITSPTISHDINIDVKESAVTKLTINELTITVSCIAKSIGIVEMLAEYIKQALLTFRKEIQRDFKLRKFRLKTISQPKNVVESQDYFSVELDLEVAFDEGWIEQRDDLKLKTVGKEIFDILSGRPLTNQ